MKKTNARAIAIAAIMIAVTTVFTLLVRIPIPGTEGYLNFSDVAINLAGFAFGPILGMVSGGIGAGLADLIGGYAQWAPITLLAHGLEGLALGLLARKGGLLRLIIASVVGLCVMVGVYYVGEAVIISDWKLALVGVPFNLLQGAVGGLIGIPLFFAVRRAYPPLVDMARGKTWREG